MVTSISAEFEVPEMAELAMGRIRSGIRGVYSARVSQPRDLSAGEENSGTLVSVIPTYANSYSMNFMTAVTEYPASKDAVPEPRRSRKSTAYIVCDGSGINEINAVLNSMGAVNIRSNQPPLH